MIADCEDLLLKADESVKGAFLLHRAGLHDQCASRCYYAMFYAAEAMLLLKGLSFSSHAAVCAAFGRELAKTGLVDMRCHQSLVRAFQTRQLADYRAKKVVTADRASELAAEAKDFVEVARKFCSQSGAGDL